MRIGSKLFLGFLCMSVLTVGLLWLIQAGIMHNNYLNGRIQAIDRAIENASKKTPIDYPELESSLNINLMAVNANGEVEYMSGNMPMRGMMLRQITAYAGQLTEGKAVYFKPSEGMRYGVLGRSFSGNSVFAVFSLVDVEEASKILLNQLWIITLVLLVLSAIIAVFLSRLFSRPIKNITQAARAMAGGKLDINLPLRSKDEIADLTKALNELSAELQKTEELRKELIANVSHELRSPLSVIQGFAETVRDVTWPDEAKRISQLTIISEEASRLSKVVSDILDYSRLQAGVDRPAITDFEVCPVLKSITDRYELDAKQRDVQLALDCTGHLARFDEGHFTRAVGNLLTNALNHAEKGSVVQIKAEAQNKAMLITVQNSGPPILPEELKYIWDKYYRANQIQENRPAGTGLGLSIVKSIFEKHGVSYGVTSENKTTSFWFETLPIE